MMCTQKPREVEASGGLAGWHSIWWLEPFSRLSGCEEWSTVDMGETGKGQEHPRDSGKVCEMVPIPMGRVAAREEVLID